MRCVPLRIPNYNSNNPNFSKVPFFSDGDISVLKVEKVRVVRHSVFSNSKFQILDKVNNFLESKNLYVGYFTSQAKNGCMSRNLEKKWAKFWFEK
jgi:hypothetical protein